MYLFICLFLSQYNLFLASLSPFLICFILFNNLNIIIHQFLQRILHNLYLQHSDHKSHKIR
ncbi:hypothetical protein Mgra_00008916 [Meloidogyne graminicola]|uniref:Uncharacterized protein n=1 Tax=Meloidogyne graminicola TaxID=189291 RepID=A0A8S9ZEE7_9BILA|nr:hypothetical protein Mgra_00008916 [Meloidogyne graminicola]